MSSIPTLYPPTLPDSRAPPEMSIGRHDELVCERPIDGRRTVDLLRRANWKTERSRGRTDAFQGKEIEPREVHLFFVGLDLGEIGVDGEIGREVGPHPPLHVEADSPLRST